MRSPHTATGEQPLLSATRGRPQAVTKTHHPAAPGPGTGKVPTLPLRHHPVRLPGRTTASCKQPDRLSSRGSSHLQGRRVATVVAAAGPDREDVGTLRGADGLRKSRERRCSFQAFCSSAAPGRACKSRNFRRDAQRRSCLGASSQEAVCPSAPASRRRLP